MIEVSKCLWEEGPGKARQSSINKTLFASDSRAIRAGDARDLCTPSRGLDPNLLAEASTYLKSRNGHALDIGLTLNDTRFLLRAGLSVDAVDKDRTLARSPHCAIRFNFVHADIRHPIANSILTRCRNLVLPFLPRDLPWIISSMVNGLCNTTPSLLYLPWP